MCRALDVSESGYYAWKERPASTHEREDARIAAEIQQIFQEYRQVYGSPRIHAELKEQGVYCSRKRVARLMADARNQRQTEAQKNENHR